jgi:hypothetical protein
MWTRVIAVRYQKRVCVCLHRMRAYAALQCTTDFGSCCLGIADCMQGVLCIIFCFQFSTYCHLWSSISCTGWQGLVLQLVVCGGVDRKSVAIDKWLVLPGGVWCLEPTGIPDWLRRTPLCSGCLASFASRRMTQAGRVLPFPCVRVSSCRSLLFAGTPCCRVQAKPLCLDGPFITPVCDALNGH